MLKMVARAGRPGRGNLAIGVAVSVALHLALWGVARQLPSRSPQPAAAEAPVSIRIAYRDAAAPTPAEPTAPPAEPVSRSDPESPSEETPALARGAPSRAPEPSTSPEVRRAPSPKEPDRRDDLAPKPGERPDVAEVEIADSATVEGATPDPAAEGDGVEGADADGAVVVPPGAGGRRSIGGVRDLSKVDLALRPRADKVPTLLDAPPQLKSDGKKDDVKLMPIEGGGYRYEDSTFVARIAADGQVEIRDKWPEVGINPGSVEFLEGPQPLIIRPPSFVIKIDFTDVIMRAVGDDPYLHRKLTFLEKTLDFRVKLAAEACSERLTQAIYDLKTDLELIWADTAVSATVRRQQLFQVWDDCADGPDDAKLAGYGDQARATVIAFIKTELPAASPLAFTRGELVALNRRRRSSSSFDPYGTFGQ